MFSGSTECSIVYRNQFIQFRFKIRHDHSVQNLKLFSAHNEIEAERHIVQNLKFSSGYSFTDIQFTQLKIHINHTNKFQFRILQHIHHTDTLINIKRSYYTNHHEA
jgi:outer membrane protein assembly factor BamA